MKRLYRKNGYISGVCSGIADYFHVDVSVIRLIFVILSLYTSKTVLFYLIASYVIDRNPYEI